MTAKKAISSMLLGLVSVVAIVLSGCQNQHNASRSSQSRITEEELRAYCPLAYMREGGSFYNTYERGATDNPEKIIYQVSMSDTTRSCKYQGGQLRIKAAAAGRIVPGPSFRAGTITMPIRVTVMQGDQTLYSKLHNYSLKANYGTEAVQFIFVDDQIVLPAPKQHNLRIYIGFEPGGRKS